MKYFFTLIFGTLSICLSLMVARTSYLAITVDPIWWLITLGILLPCLVSVLITVSAYSAAKDY